MLISDNEKKVVDILRGRIDEADTGTLFFNNSFPEYNDVNSTSKCKFTELVRKSSPVVF